MAAETGYNPVIMGVGMSLPERVITNEDLCNLPGAEIDFPHTIIKRVTGVETRRWFDPDNPIETLSTHATNAARYALKMAEVEVDQLAGIIVATATPSAPPISGLVHGKLGASETCNMFDMNGACAGGVKALDVGFDTMLAKRLSHVLVIGAELLSTHTNLRDRTTATLFGDGVGAAVLGWSEGAIRPTAAPLAVSAPTAVYKTRWENWIIMEGAEVKEHAGYILAEGSLRAAHAAGLTKPDDPQAIDWKRVKYLVPHQASKPIARDLQNNLHIPPGQLITDSLEVHGNTSAASIFLAIGTALVNNSMETGEYDLVLAGAGASVQGMAVAASARFRHQG